MNTLRMNSVAHVGKKVVWKLAFPVTLSIEYKKY